MILLAFVFHAMLSDTEAWQAKVSRVGRPKSVLSRSDARDLPTLAASISTFYQRKFDDFLRVSAAEQKPLLYCYQSDGWSRITSSLLHAEVPGAKITRDGRVLAEFNLEREVLKSIDRHGKVEMTQVFAPPRVMLKGKSGWHVFQASTESREMLRHMAPFST